MANEPAPTSAPPAAPAAPAPPPDNRNNSPLHVPPSAASLAIAARSAADPLHPANSSRVAGELSPTQWVALSASEQNRYMQVRGAEGEGERYVPRGPQPAGDGKPNGQEAAPAGDLPRLKVGDFELTEAEWRDLAAHKAAQDSRKALLPAGPNEYRAELPPDLVLPGGLKYELNQRDPMLGVVRNLAHEFGLDQQQFSKSLGAVAELRATEEAQLKAAYDDQVKQLGANATTRVDAVAQWINGIAGADAKPLADMMKVAPLAATIRAFEKLMQRFSSQGAAPGAANHQEAAPTGPSEATWNSWSFGQRQNWQRTGNPNDNSWASTDGARGFNGSARG